MKPGFLTSEFWLLAATIAGNLYLANAGQLNATTAVCLVIASVIYAMLRTTIKNNAAREGLTAAVDQALEERGVKPLPKEAPLTGMDVMPVILLSLVCVSMLSLVSCSDGKKARIEEIARTENGNPYWVEYRDRNTGAHWLETGAGIVTLPDLAPDYEVEAADSEAPAAVGTESRGPSVLDRPLRSIQIGPDGVRLER